ncbi:MAG TPA: 23S rRNA (pseudouridine(1915)-N(3))-methyltransferase RlmH [Gemmatimonadales bacterium]|jgi:23S rRNA (pseudouridine1915-N3)-methyltransferase
MDIEIVAVGKLRPYYRQAADDYIRRLRRYAHVREQEVREASRAPNTALQRGEEAARLEAKIPDGGTVVALAREGVGWSSRELARQMERWQLQGRSLAFLIGGSSGLDTSVIGRASARWSLGPLTFPHELARVILCEQLYRAYTILRGEPYHKGV